MSRPLKVIVKTFYELFVKFWIFQRVIEVIRGLIACFFFNTSNVPSWLYYLLLRPLAYRYKSDGLGLPSGVGMSITSFFYYAYIAHNLIVELEPDREYGKLAWLYFVKYLMILKASLDIFKCLNEQDHTLTQLFTSSLLSLMLFKTRFFDYESLYNKNLSLAVIDATLEEDYFEAAVICIKFVLIHTFFDKLNQADVIAVIVNLIRQLLGFTHGLPIRRT